VRRIQFDTEVFGFKFLSRFSASAQRDVRGVWAPDLKKKRPENKGTDNKPSAGGEARTRGETMGCREMWAQHEARGTAKRGERHRDRWLDSRANRGSKGKRGIQGDKKKKCIVVEEKRLGSGSSNGRTISYRGGPDTGKSIKKPTEGRRKKENRGQTTIY